MTCRRLLCYRQGRFKVLRRIFSRYLMTSSRHGYSWVIPSATSLCTFCTAYRLLVPCSATPPVLEA